MAESEAAGGATRSYEGDELEIFLHAERWKSYWASLVKPFVRGDVLEVGAGIGGSTARLAEDHEGGWLCLEPDAAMARDLRAAIAEGRLKADAEVLCGQLEALPEEARFDTVIYIDVLEHIEDDAGELRQVESLLNPGGCVIVLAPAYNWLYSPFDATVGHVRRYTAGLLDAAAPDTMERVAYGYVDSAGLPLSLANRMLLRQEMPKVRQIRFWDRYVVPISRVLDPLHAGSFGKTLIAVYRKPGGAALAAEADRLGPLTPDKGALLTKAKRFAAIGVLNTLIHVGLFALLVDLLRWSAPTPGTGIAFLVATGFSYLCNYRWTYGMPGNHRRRMPRFFAVTTALFLLNLLIMHAAVAWLGWHHWVGLGIVVAVIPVSSFLLTTFWAFAGGEARVSHRSGKG